MSEEISGPVLLIRGTIINRGRNITKADIYECDYDGRKAILKDYGDRNSLARYTAGKWFSKREFMIYQDLKGVSGIPFCLARPDKFSFVLEHIDGNSLPDSPPQLVSASVFRLLKSIIEDIHERGIACGDIHHRDILITSDGKPYLVDFVTGWKKGGKSNVIRNLIFTCLCSLDWLSFYRIRQKYIGIGPSADEKKDFSRIIWLYNSGRLLKSIFNYLRGKK